MIAQLARLICAVMFLALAGLAAVTTWAGVTTENDPETVASVTGYSPARLATIEAQFAKPDGLSREKALAQVRDILAPAPLSANAVAFGGLAALQAGDGAQADSAFSLAFRRNPRNEAARIWLAQRAIDAGDLNRAIGLLDRLIIIDRERSSLYTEALAQLASMPGGVEAIATRMDGSPSWGNQVVSRLNKTLTDLDLLLELNRHTPGTQREYIARVLKEVGPEAAFKSWLQFVPEAEAAGFTWPYDAGFLKKTAPAPFNWSVLSDLAEFITGGGLDLTYLGRGRLALIEQTMLLAPGRYKFSTRMSGDARDNGGGFGWAVECLSGRQELGRVVTRPLTSKSSSYSFDFEVPAQTCPAQKIVLRGEPGEFPIRAHAELQSVAIAPVAEQEGR